MIHPRIAKKIIREKIMEDIFGLRSNISDDEDFYFEKTYDNDEAKKARRNEILRIIQEYNRRIGELKQEYFELDGKWQSDDGLD